MRQRVCPVWFHLQEAMAQATSTSDCQQQPECFVASKTSQPRCLTMHCGFYNSTSQVCYAALWLLEGHMLGVLQCTVASVISQPRCLANNRHFCFLVLKAGRGRSKHQQFPFWRGPAFWFWFMDDTFLAFFELLS